MQYGALIIGLVFLFKGVDHLPHLVIISGGGGK